MIRHCTLAAIILLSACASKNDATPAPAPVGDGGADASPSPTGPAPAGDAGGPPTTLDLSIVPCESGATDPKCSAPSKANAGMFGSGPVFSAYGFTDDIRGGFLAGSSLVVAVETGGTGDGFGAIMSVDLATGNRKVVSGQRANGEALVGTGTMETNRGVTSDVTNLDNVRDVKPLPSGHYLAMISGARTILIDIDPATGNRTPVWASNSADDVTQRDVDEKGWVSEATHCPAEPNSPYMQPTVLSMAVSPNGTAYLGLFGPGPKGILQVALAPQPLDTRCTITSMASSVGLDKGTGYVPNQIDALLFGNNKIYGVYAVAQTFLTFDALSGDRAVLSASQAPTMGSGTVSIGQRGLALTSDGASMWQTGSTQQLTDDSFNLLKVDLATGNRVAVSSNISDVVSDAPSVQVKGSLSGNLHDDTQGVWTVPGSPLLVVNMEDAIHLVDPATSTANLLSH